MASSLDIPERQVLVRYDGDANVTWHHRVLLHQIGGASWVVSTPDFDIQVVDLAAERVLALVRNAAFPARVGGDIYAFDNPADPMDLARMRAEGAAFAAVMGAPIAAGLPGLGAATIKWLYADPARATFGTEVDAQVMSTLESCVVKGASALVLVAGSDPPVWTFAERVSDDDAPLWKAEKQAGAGRDLRLGRPTQTKSDGPAVLLRDAVVKLVLVDGIPNFPFRGVRAVKEYLSGIVASGYELSTFHGHWVRVSGVTASSGLAIEHSLLMMLLHLLVIFDGMNVYNLASAEHAVRRLLMIERAVKRSPRAPDFDGLEVYLSNTFDSSGGVVTSDFDRHIAEIKKSEAIILKQDRLWKEEQDHEAKKASRGSDVGKGKTKGGGGASAASTEK
jgi:hypothetical protein